LRQLIPHAIDQLVTILGAVCAAQHFGAQASTYAPIQPGQLSINRTGQALAAAGNQATQFSVQGVKRRGHHVVCCLVHVVFLAMCPMSASATTGNPRPLLTFMGKRFLRATHVRGDEVWVAIRELLAC
jgi:hypothetical protein